MMGLTTFVPLMRHVESFDMCASGLIFSCGKLIFDITQKVQVVCLTLWPSSRCWDTIAVITSILTYAQVF